MQFQKNGRKGNIGCVVVTSAPRSPSVRSKPFQSIGFEHHHLRCFTITRVVYTEPQNTSSSSILDFIPHPPAPPLTGPDWRTSWSILIPCSPRSATRNNISALFHDSGEHWEPECVARQQQEHSDQYVLSPNLGIMRFRRQFLLCGGNKERKNFRSSPDFTYVFPLCLLTLSFGQLSRRRSIREKRM